MAANFMEVSPWLRVSYSLTLLVSIATTLYLGVVVIAGGVGEIYFLALVAAAVLQLVGMTTLLRSAATAAMCTLSGTFIAILMIIFAGIEMTVAIPTGQLVLRIYSLSVAAFITLPFALHVVAAILLRRNTVADSA
jgi:hypothetical protein